MIQEKVKIRDIELGVGSETVFVAGPCVIENYEMLNETAEFLWNIKKSRGKKIIMKISYDKANRTSLNSFRGPGLEKGLEMASRIKEKYEIPILIDVHCKNEVSKVAEICDCIQIPAFLCRQTDLLIEAGRSGKPVNIKKGQFMSPWAMGLQARKVSQTSDAQVILTERGTSFGYGELVVDMRSIIIMKNAGYPVLFDATHSQQQPATDKETAGGRKEFILPLAKAAMSVGADGIYCEVHPHPENAGSDKDTQLSFKEFERLIDELSKMQGSE